MCPLERALAAVGAHLGLAASDGGLTQVFWGWKTIWVSVHKFYWGPVWVDLVSVSLNEGFSRRGFSCRRRGSPGFWRRQMVEKAHTGGGNSYCTNHLHPSAMPVSKCCCEWVSDQKLEKYKKLLKDKIRHADARLNSYCTNQCLATTPPSLTSAVVSESGCFGPKVR